MSYELTSKVITFSKHLFPNFICSTGNPARAGLNDSLDVQ